MFVAMGDRGTSAATPHVVCVLHASGTADEAIASASDANEGERASAAVTADVVEFPRLSVAMGEPAGVGVDVVGSGD